MFGGSGDGEPLLWNGFRIPRVWRRVARQQAKTVRRRRFHNVPLTRHADFDRIGKALVSHLPYRFDLDGNIERERIYANSEARMQARVAENLDEKIRGSVYDPGLVVEGIGACHKPADAQALDHTIK
ncbi:MAG: hypothetical protein FD124_2145 [Alphaproteobacteria bacterium]|nr:MAG: hypothetical protein FD160_3223 [Caulobacteraceae bacterium]TPW05480.1 MAG: hypothetical protein FD124_2145 [Alphaproteobacteria bacterium]